MAASIISEEESGTYTSRIHPHNGYSAGDFSAPWVTRRAAAGFLVVPPTLLQP